MLQGEGVDGQGCVAYTFEASEEGAPARARGCAPAPGRGRFAAGCWAAGVSLFSVVVPVVVGGVVGVFLICSRNHAVSQSLKKKKKPTQEKKKGCVQSLKMFVLFFLSSFSFFFLIFISIIFLHQYSPSSIQ